MTSPCQNLLKMRAVRFIPILSCAGFLLGVLGTGTEGAKTSLPRTFRGKDDVIGKNISACAAGHELGLSIFWKGREPLGPPGKRRSRKNDTERVMPCRLGLAAGCTFVTAYPMSPATGVLSFFAKKKCGKGAGAVIERGVGTQARVVGASARGPVRW